ncbi:vascular endothelial growth factor Ab isoform X1 [Gymnodraco acuticeps]|uniref:Vascular endothelial growth factor Ab isoform X1 n=1 Tax=Gymnodraco acuticeps TaxID=8218 RepID=A0A6P8TQ50_GYMAC|nr:vascular endothelial growth factor Ab isoform X1 [Gymnodraco acuticeps]
MLRPRDQHGFAITTPCPLFREVLAGPLVLLLLLLLLQTSCLRTNRHIGLLDFKRRLPLDWISNTMNFIDSLTLLFLTLSAVKSAHIPKEPERGPHAVIPLMEVYNKSLCKPRELLVEIMQEYPEEVEHIFIPSCVVLTRCAGCCNDEMMQCMPTSSYNVTMEIKRIKPQRQQNDIFMSFTEHSACECRSKIEVKEKKPRKGKGKGQKRKRKKNRDKTIHDALCEPCCEHCSERRKRLFVQDPTTCRCSCKHTDEYCKERQLELNERTCKCDKPRR